MGKRGPKPTPTAILKIRGSRVVERRGAEPVVIPGKPDCPKWLTEEAKQIWDQIAPPLNAMGVLAPIDGLALARYCATLARWKAATMFLTEHGESHPIRDRHGRFRRFAKFPQVAIANQLSTTLSKLEAEFGLTPASRANIQIVHRSNPQSALEQFLLGATN